MNINTDFPCENRAKSFNEALQRPTFVKTNDLYEKYYKEMGFKHFKLEGRTYPFNDLIENYCYFFVKPEYKEQVIEYAKKG